MLRVTLSILVFLIGLLGGLQIAQAQTSAGFLQITTSDSKTLLADRAFVKQQQLDFRIFLNEKTQVCFVGDAVAAQAVVSAVLGAGDESTRVFPGRVDLGVDTFQQGFQYGYRGTLRQAAVQVARCKQDLATVAQLKK